MPNSLSLTHGASGPKCCSAVWEVTACCVVVLVPVNPPASRIFLMLSAEVAGDDVFKSNRPAGKHETAHRARRGFPNHTDAATCLLNRRRSRCVNEIRALHAAAVSAG